MKPTFFKTADAFRQWLEHHHATATELLVGFYKKDSGRPSITYPEALDEALCFGWIDGVRKRIDEISYSQRFTPRKPKSNWSLLNIEHVERLKKAGRMAPAGLAAHAAREAKRTGVYSFEQREQAKFDTALEKTFRAQPRAWEFFQAQPPSYRRLTTFWVMSAKREETRQRRLAQLIKDSANSRRIGALA